MMSAGSVGAFCSKITFPASSTTHTDVSFTDIKTHEIRHLIAPSSMLEIEPTSIHSSSQKGLHTQPSKAEPQPLRYIILRLTLTGS